MASFSFSFSLGYNVCLYRKGHRKVRILGSILHTLVKKKLNVRLAASFDRITLAKPWSELCF